MNVSQSLTTWTTPLWLSSWSFTNKSIRTETHQSLGQLHSSSEQKHSICIQQSHPYRIRQLIRLLRKSLFTCLNSVFTLGLHCVDSHNGHCEPLARIERINSKPHAEPPILQKSLFYSSQRNSPNTHHKLSTPVFVSHWKAGNHLARPILRRIAW